MDEKEAEATTLLNKLGKIDKLEERQNYHAKEIKEIKLVLSNTEMDGRLTKVEKRQEFVFEQLKDVHKDIQIIEEKCDKQRSSCMGSVAPLTLVSSLKEDIQRMILRFESSLSTIEASFRTVMKETNDRHAKASEESAKWNRWSFITAMLAFIMSGFALVINVISHLPK
jgi:hypothetical protein